MNVHESVRELLALAAAGVLDAAGERRVREHVRECAACAAELEELRSAGEGLRDLPFAQPPPFLLARTQALVAGELARRAEARWRDAALLGVSALGWTVSFAIWAAYRIAAGGAANLTATGWKAVAAWIAVSTALAWLTGGAAAVLLGRRKGAGYESI